MCAFLKQPKRGTYHLNYGMITDELNLEACSTENATMHKTKKLNEIPKIREAISHC